MISWNETSTFTFASTSSLIPVKRFIANVGKFRFVFFIYLDKIWESTLNFILTIECQKLQQSFNLSPVTACFNSRSGIVRVFSLTGDNFWLAVIGSTFEICYCTIGWIGSISLYMKLSVWFFTYINTKPTSNWNFFHMVKLT